MKEVGFNKVDSEKVKYLEVSYSKVFIVKEFVFFFCLLAFIFGDYYLFEEEEF